MLYVLVELICLLKDCAARAQTRVDPILGYADVRTCMSAVNELVIEVEVC